MLGPKPVQQAHTTSFTIHDEHTSFPPSDARIRIRNTKTPPTHLAVQGSLDGVPALGILRVSLGGGVSHLPRNVERLAARQALRDNGPVGCGLDCGLRLEPRHGGEILHSRKLSITLTRLCCTQEGGGGWIKGNTKTMRGWPKTHSRCRHLCAPMEFGNATLSWSDWLDRVSVREYTRREFIFPQQLPPAQSLGCRKHRNQAVFARC